MAPVTRFLAPRRVPQSRAWRERFPQAYKIEEHRTRPAGATEFPFRALAPGSIGRSVCEFRQRSLERSGLLWCRSLDLSQIPQYPRFVLSDLQTAPIVLLQPQNARRPGIACFYESAGSREGARVALKELLSQHLWTASRPSADPATWLDSLVRLRRVYVALMFLAQSRVPGQDITPKEPSLSRHILLIWTNFYQLFTGNACRDCRFSQAPETEVQSGR